MQFGSVATTVVAKAYDLQPRAHKLSLSYFQSWPVEVTCPHDVFSDVVVFGPFVRTQDDLKRIITKCVFEVHAMDVFYHTELFNGLVITF